jgi:hypothetical protein
VQDDGAGAQPVGPVPTVVNQRHARRRPGKRQPNRQHAADGARPDDGDVREWISRVSGRQSSLPTGVGRLPHAAPKIA